ncbi:DUF6578 domain-containing protein [Geodermatophilus sp. DSM 45219]|uniref:DUF6578 domain-containing protein n=1 Tax=Geodermatophilus sp. DSM 45219 TaxID=1881103 RepID=UPI000B88043B|nr:DUF6578 domain-containing protein [Geodermatophilus sp. DSM 45219]
MDVVVEVGGWEHACCGQAIERNQLVDFHCFRREEPDGGVRLIESHHGGLDVSTDERVQGRVTEIQVVQDRDAPSVLRVPSGQELHASEEADEDLLEDPWTGDAIPSRSGDFLVTVQTSR